MSKFLQFSLLGLIFLSANFAAAQNYLISSPDHSPSNPMPCDQVSAYVNANVVNFSDGGGPYSPNQNEIVTFCPDLDQAPKMNLALGTNMGFSLDIHPSDTLYVYDGSSTSSPLIAKINNATFPMGGSWMASFDNPQGCLTLRFLTNGANEGEGWEGTIACANPPQPFEMHMEGFVNGSAANAINPIDTGYINVCNGDQILLVAKPLFVNSQETTGTGYSQTLENVNYSWNISGLGDLPTNNDSITFTPANGQGYYVTLTITDQFPYVETMSMKIRVAVQPSFVTAGPVEDTICLGSQVEMIGGINAADTAGVTIPGGSFAVGGSFAGLTALPDGGGISYQTTVNISGMGVGNTVTSPNDITSVCLDIEHSFIGDLEITLTCPSGVQVSLMNTYAGGIGIVPGGCSGGGLFLGSDTNIDNGPPGSPVETYCFSTVSPEFGTVCANLNNTYTNPYGFASLIPGTYTPDGNYNDFIGCPLDGDWTITVRDNQGIDDGYIFQWGITFDASLYPNTETYQNYAVDAFWTPHPTIISGLNDTSIIVQPTSPGTTYYQYNAIDNFGCAYDTLFRLVTIQSPSIFQSTHACDLQYQVAGTVTAPGGGVWSSTPAGLTYNQNSLNPLITATQPGTYTMTFIDNACQDTVSSTLYFPPYPEIFDDTALCTDGYQVVGTVSDPQGGTWSATFTDVIFSPSNTVLNPVISATNAGVYQITYTDNICQNTATSTLTIYPLPHIFPDTQACFLNYFVSGTTATDGGVWASADTAITFSNPNLMNPQISASVPGIYEVSFTDNQCGVTTTSTIDFIAQPYVNGFDTTICEGATFPIVLYTSPFPQNDYYNWSNGATGPSITGTAGNTYVVTTGNECGTHNATVNIYSKVCKIEVPNIISLSSKTGNDKFYLSYNGVKSIDMVIVNRWGQTIYEIRDPSKPWDGRDKNGNVVPEGTYFYTLVADMETGSKINQQGFVQVYH